MENALEEYLNKVTRLLVFDKKPTTEVIFQDVWRTVPHGRHALHTCHAERTAH